MGVNEVQINLNIYTREIKEKEVLIVSNFLAIGQKLKVVRDDKVYKQKYNEFGDYIESEGFHFSRRHADRMIQIATEFQDINVSNIGISKCLDILRLPAPTREVIKEELSKDEPDLVSVDKTIQDSQELQEEERVEESPVKVVVNVSDKVEALDHALDYLNEELDNVYISLKDYDKEDYQRQYKADKVYFKTKYSGIGVKLREADSKIKRAKILLRKLKGDVR